MRLEQIELGPAQRHQEIVSGEKRLDQGGTFEIGGHESSLVRRRPARDELSLNIRTGWQLSQSADARSRISAMERSHRAIVPDQTQARLTLLRREENSMDNPLASGPVGLLGTCLVVEDDSIIRLDIEETLRGFGFSCVLGASTLEAAADIAATAAIGFAVLDYEIGRCNTVALAEQLRAKGVPAGLSHRPRPRHRTAAFAGRPAGGG